MRSFVPAFLLLVKVFTASGLDKYECTDTTGSTIPLQIVKPGHRIELMTPNYPNPFKNTWLDCVWKIQGLHGTRVEIKLVDMGLNEACNDNILRVKDDSSKGSGSKLESPGLTARCGQSTFPPPNQIALSDGVVTVRFKSSRNTGNARFRLIVSGAVPNACPAKISSGCPDGPCCYGEDCCVINAGNEPIEIMSPNFPKPSGPGLNCQYTMVTAYGSQIALNFLKMDIRTDSNQACLSDFITLEDPAASPASMIGSKKTFCGQKLPNYPAPSVLVSAGNTLVLRYQTDSSKSIKGSGFKATVSAVNPTCNKMQFEYQYGEEVCNSTCGVPYETTVTTTKQTTTTITQSTTSHLVNETCEEKDVVYEGNVLGVKEDVQTWEECAHACLMWDACTHFSWTPDKSCSAKDTFEGKSEQPGTVSGTESCGELATTEPTPTGITPTGVTPGTATTPELIHNKTCIEEGRFYDSVDGQKQIKNIKSWQECAYLCQLDPECKGFTWASPAFFEATVIYLCALKPKLVIGTSEGGPESKIVGAVRGKKECGEYVSTTTTTSTTTTLPLKNETCQRNDTHHKGTPLKSMEDINSWEHCAHLCQETDECEYWSYFTESFVVNSMVGQCDLQKSDEGHREASGVISGSAECGEWITTTPQPQTVPPLQNKTCGNFDEDITGTPIKIIHVIESWEHCAYLCNKDNKCQFWTWTSSRFPLDSFVGDCDLKEMNLGTRNVTGVFSGTSDCGQPPTEPPATTIPPSTPYPSTEVFTTPSKKCSEGVELSVTIFDQQTGDPIPRAIVTIRSKEVTIDEGIPSLYVTHVADANGRVVEEGAIGGTYNVHIMYETENFMKQFDWKITAMDVTCTNEECTKCEESIRVRAPNKELENENCTCKSEVRLLNELTQLPIADACISVSVQEQPSSRSNLIESSRNGSIESSASSEYEDSEYGSSQSSEHDEYSSQESDSFEMSNEDTGDVLDRDALNRAVFDQNTCEKIGVFYKSVSGQKVIKGVASWHECAFYCRQNDNCAGFTWTDKNFPTPSLINMCNLKPEIIIGGVMQGVVSGSRECGECQLRTDFQGRVEILTGKIGDYFLTVSHPDFATTKFRKTIEPVIEGDCDYCNIKLQINMTKDICNMEETTVNLKVIVTNNDTKEYIEDASVYIEVYGVEDQTDTDGAVSFPIKENGKYRIRVSAPGMNAAFKEEDVSCDPKDCEKCNPSVAIPMAPVYSESTIPPTEAPCDKPVKRQINLITLDAQTKENLHDVTYSIYVNGRYVAKNYDVAGTFSNGVEGFIFDIQENGKYHVQASSPGYKPNYADVDIYCTNTDCEDCLHSITLDLKPNVCEETDLTISVKDAGSNAPIEGARVKVNDVLRKKSLGSNFTTDINGMVVVISSGEATLSVEVEKNGYTFINDTKDIICTQPCASCNPELILKITEEFCERVDIDLEILVQDEKENPVIGAVIKMRMTASAEGPLVEPSSSEELRTNEDGTSVAPLLQKGTYLLEITAIGYQPMSREIIIDNSTSCQTRKIPVAIKIITEPEPEHFCKKGQIIIDVYDRVTKKPLPGASVTVKNNQGFSAIDVKTNQIGDVVIPVTADGVYKVKVSKEGHVEEELSLTIDYPKKCLAYGKVILDEKTCPHTIMPIRVTDNFTDKAVPNALVKVILVKTKEGPEFTELDEPKYTDDNGTAYFNVPMNGEYKVEVTVDGYETIEVPKDVHCNVDHCEGCAPNVVVIARPSFCPEKSLKLIIMDCITNALISGATVDTTLDTVGTEYTSIKVDSSISADSGEVIIPLSENGMYNSIITLEGYGTIMNSYEVNVDKDECDVFNPVDTVPICPPAKPGCTRVTLAWANDKDIDLNGFRMNKTNTNDTCTTKPSCCDHCKKEDCPGVTPGIDDEDGLNGTETITYCNTSDYTNMLYISDPTGEGEFLPTSGAKIVITLGEREQVIRLDDISRPEGAKYWLAGCLTTKEASFDFITINKFFDTKPDDEDSLLCFDRVKEAEESLSNIVLKNAQLEVNFYDADTKDPIVGAMAEASTLTESISRLSKVDGKSTIKITKNGEYIIDATAEGYVGAENAVTVECPVCKTIGKTNPGRNCVFPFSYKGKVYNKCAKWGLKFWCGFQYEFKDNEWGFCDPSVCPTGAGKACTETVAFSMVPEGRNDKVEIVLNWGDQADNLDLHTIQVHNQVSNNWCETYFGKKSGCSLTKLDQDIKNGGASGGEKITISPLGKVPYTYMIVVKDNSAYKNQLDNSEGSIHISDGVRSLSRSLPNFGSGTPEGAYYWFVGCLRIVDKSFVFSPVDKLARQSPYVTERLYCNDLFKENPSAGVKPYDQFCNDVTMNVRFTIPNNQRGSPAKINIISVDNNGEEKIILAKTVKYWSSVVKTPITTNGKYIVKVEGEDYTSTENEYIVRCKKLDCKTCKPSFVVPLITVPNNEDQVKIILSWTGPSNALIAKSQVVDSSIAMEQCYSTSQNKSTCYSTKSAYEDNYFELEEFSKLLAGKAGTVLVKLSDALASAKPDARVTITDSKRTVTARVNMQDYQGEDYWLPFCIFTDGETFRLYGGPVFFNKASLDTYSEQYCARGF